MKTRRKVPAFPRHFTEDELRKRDDYEWALNDTEVRRKYGGKIVVVYQKKILGVGKTFQAAWAAAQRRRDCPPRHEVSLPVVPYLMPASSA